MRKLERKINQLLNDLKNSLKNKELKISFYNLEKATQWEINFFYSIINYRIFTFVKYITWNNFTYIISFIIGLSLILLIILSQKHCIYLVFHSN